MKFTIDRSKWRTGEWGDHATGKGDTSLLNSEGFMCCLGQICEQRGLSNKLLIHEVYPSCLTYHIHFEGLSSISFLIRDEGDHFKSSPLAVGAIRINDDQETTPKQKEEALTKLFAGHGHEIEFTGEAVPHNH